MARPREHTDDELLDRVARALNARGEAHWTLADVAVQAGVRPPTLIKRFGSKKGLMLALGRRWAQSTPTVQTGDDPQAELLAWACRSYSPDETRNRAVAHMAMLMSDLADDDLSAVLRLGWERQLAYVSSLIDGIKTAGHLPASPDPDIAASLLIDILNGGFLRAAAYPSPESAFDPTHTLTTLLESWT
ncbi:TetR/AcrR family transcriptional regulator [Saccharopolyspora sp. NPDC003752]